jgi:hypothetical protein
MMSLSGTQSACRCVGALSFEAVATIALRVGQRMFEIKVLLKLRGSSVVVA